MLGITIYYFLLQKLTESQEKLPGEEIIKEIHNESFGAILHNIFFLIIVEIVGRILHTLFLDFLKQNAPNVSALRRLRILMP